MLSSQWFNGDRIKSQLEERDLDAVIAVSPESVFYISRVYLATQYLIRERFAFVVWPRDGEPTLIVCDIEEGVTRPVTWIRDIRTYPEYSSKIDLLSRVLEEKNLGKGAIGIEKNYLPASAYEKLLKRLPNGRFFEADSLFENARSVKTSKEIEWMREGGRILDKAMLQAAELITSRDTERKISESIISAARKLGRKAGIDNLTSDITSGERTLVVHKPPLDRRIERGDIVHLHCRATFNQYWIHLVRRAVVGEPDSHQKSMYSKYFKIYEQSMEDLKAGRTAGEIHKETWDECVKAFSAKYLDAPRWSKVGHSTGINVIEPPSLRSGENWMLEPGMVFAWEPIITDPGKAIYWLEDEVVISNGGAKRISNVFPLDNLYEIK